MKGDLRAETTTITGYGGDGIEAYLSGPLDDGRFGGVVVIHHMPGYDEGTKEIARTFAAPRLCSRYAPTCTCEAPGAPPDEAASTVRAAGGVPDERLVGDVAGAVEFLKSLPHSNGKAGTIGYCSGGRQSFFAACGLELDAAVDCYGAFVVTAPPKEIGLKIGPIVHLAEKLSCPLLGLFGAEDQHPSPPADGGLEEALTSTARPSSSEPTRAPDMLSSRLSRPNFNVEAAADGWSRIWAFFGRHLAS